MITAATLNDIQRQGQNKYGSTGDKMGTDQAVNRDKRFLWIQESKSDLGGQLAPGRPVIVQQSLLRPPDAEYIPAVMSRRSSFRSPPPSSVIKIELVELNAAAGSIPQKMSYEK
jgi:hypothetical protein